MASARAKRPDPFLLALAAILECAPSQEAVITAAAAARAERKNPRVLSTVDELWQVFSRKLDEDRADRLVSDREAAAELGIKTKTWQAWVREDRHLAALAEPGAGPRRWRMSRIREWQP